MNHTVSDRPIYRPIHSVNIEPVFWNGDTETISTVNRQYVDNVTLNHNSFQNSADHWFQSGDVKISLREIVELKQQVEELRAEVLKLKTGQIKLHTEEVEL